MAMTDAVKVLLQGTWIGWKIESNWTDPFVFFAYMIAKPLASVFLIGLIFLIGSEAAGVRDPDFFFYAFTGAIFFIYPATMIVSLGYLIHEDRAKYEVLKQIYIAPESVKPYIFGRAFAAAINATISVIIAYTIGTMFFGNIFGLELGVNMLTINYSVLIFAVFLGIVAFSFLGLLLCAINLLSYKLQYSITEYATGIMFLLSGVVFPLSMLPLVAQQVGYALPSTYFLDLVRLSISGSAIGTIDMVYMIASTVLFAAFALFLFKFAEYRARQRGMIDRKAEY